MIIITEGKETGGTTRMDAINAALDAKNQGTIILTVGPRADSDQALLKEMSSPTSDPQDKNWWIFDHNTDIHKSTICQEILDKICGK